MAEGAAIARGGWLRHAIRLEALTIGWNVVEAMVALGAGALAGSIALVGFGIDSLIETLAATALYRRLRAETGASSAAEVEAHERRALTIVGWTFLALAVYILYEASSTLWAGRHTAPSPVGLVLAAVSLVVMPVLGVAKLRAGRALGSRALVGDAKETFVCSYLSLSLLVGLGANAYLGIWWADPVAALLMAPWLVKEGREALGEDGCDGAEDDACRDVRDDA